MTSPIEALRALRSPGDPSPQVLRTFLGADWRCLFPFRSRHGDAIRKVLNAMPELVAARAAFGCGDLSSAPDWLWKDFYLSAPPARRSVDRALGELRRGDVSELTELLDSPLPQAYPLLAIWYEVSALAGRVIGQPITQRGSTRETPLLSPEVSLVAGGPPAVVENEQDMRLALQDALRGDLGLEAHRRHISEALERLLTGELASSAETFSSTLALVRHHTDALGDSLIEGLVDDGSFDFSDPPSIESILASLVPLREALSGESQFREHLRRGLESPSRPRRFLSHGFLLREGVLSEGAHPDDLAGWATGQATS